MAYTTFAAFADALVGLTYSGVTRNYSYPPQQISTADMPLMYPRLPEVSHDVIDLAYGVSTEQAQIELVFLVEPGGQNINEANFDAMVALLDAIDTTLSTNAATICANRWEIRQETAVFENTSFWALVATVEASG